VLRLIPFTYMPSPLPRQVRWKLFARIFPSSSAFPESQAGRLLRHPFRGLLSVHLVTAYRFAKSPARPSAPKASAASLPPLLLRLLPGGTNKFPGGSLTRCGSAPFHGALRNPNSAVAVRARAFSLCVAVALIVSCGSSRNKADDVKAATDAIRQQIAKYTAALDAADLNLASQVWELRRKYRLSTRRSRTRLGGSKRNLQVSLVRPFLNGS
jgi:hypothetical protein